MKTWKRTRHWEIETKAPGLQWGHVVEDVEEMSQIRKRTERPTGFNGATSLKTWKSRSAIRWW